MLDLVQHGNGKRNARLCSFVLSCCRLMSSILLLGLMLMLVRLLLLLLVLVLMLVFVFVLVLGLGLVLVLVSKEYRVESNEYGGKSTE